MTLDPNTPATISGSGPPELDVQVQNQGDSEETDVGVSFQLTGGTQTISGDGDDPADRRRRDPDRLDPDRARARHRPAAHARGDRRSRSRASRSPTTTARPTRSPSASRSVATRTAVPGLHTLGSAVAMRVAFLGPAGTFSEDALRAAVGEAEIDARPAPTVYEAIRAVAEGEAERALVPFENSIEGSVRSTLDTLAFEAPSVTIAGEHDHPIRNSLIARERAPPGADRGRALASPGQRPVRALHPRAAAAGARCAPRASTAEAVREVSASSEPWAALGRGVRGAHLRLRGPARGGRGHPRQRDPLRLDRARPAPGPRATGPWRTTLVFSELGADHPGALVEALTEFSSREVNLTRIESRPRRRGLGRYMFFVDLDGAEDEPAGRRGDRGAARQGRVGADPRQLPGRRRTGSRAHLARTGRRRAPSTILALWTRRPTLM